MLWVTVSSILLSSASMSAGVGNQIPFLLGHPLRATRHSTSGERWPDLRLGEYGSIVSHNTESCTGLQQLLPRPWNEGRGRSLFLSQRCYGDGWGNVCKASTWARRKGLFQILSVMVTGLSSVLPSVWAHPRKMGRYRAAGGVGLECKVQGWLPIPGVPLLLSLLFTKCC